MSETISRYLLDHDALYYTLLAVNLALIAFAPWLIHKLVRPIDDQKESSGELTERFWVNALRGLNVLIIALLGHFRFFGRYSGDAGDSIGVKIVSIIVVLYLSYLSVTLFGRLIRRRYGKPVQVGGVERIADTYASRILSLFLTVFICIIALISVVRIAGFSSLLETGGVIGFIGVMLALTQGAWAPDIISGLIILNSKLLAERDVIRLNDGNSDLYAIVHRTRAFHTELLSLVDNHRVMIRNSNVRDYTVHNLSRYASAKGLREALRFKLGHGLKPDKAREMFEAAYAQAEVDALPIEFQYPLEVRLQDAGDHAVEWSIHYYTKDESALMSTRQAFREQVLNSAFEYGVDLSTPLTISGSA